MTDLHVTPWTRTQHALNEGSASPLGRQRCLAEMNDAFSLHLLGEVDGEVCLVARGELDIAAAAAFRSATGELAGGTQRVVLDLRDIEFMDSTGLYALIDAHERLGDRLVVLAGESALRLLRLTGLDGVLPLAPAA
jgi:anti-sigma B factor antagonist